MLLFRFPWATPAGITSPSLDYKDHKTTIANGLPIAEENKKMVFILIITADEVNRREQQKNTKCFIWPRYMVEPQHIEEYVAVEATYPLQKRALPVGRGQECFWFP